MELNEENVNLKILMQGIYSINTSLAENKKITALNIGCRKVNTPTL